MNRSASASDWPVGQMEMAHRIREHDWAATPLGAVERWSERLKGAVEEMLASPMVGSLALGPERLHLYNDAAAQLYGDCHPRALGRPLSETWPDAYAKLAPFYGRAFAGETVEVPTLALDDSGRDGEFWEAVLTPVRDEGGTVMAVRMTGFEVGARLRESEERQTFLLRLSDALRPLADPVAIMIEASEALGRHLGVGRCAYGEIDASGQFVTVHRDYHAAPLPSVAGRYRIENYGAETLQTLRRGQTFFLEDVLLEPSLSDAETHRRYAAMRVRAAVVVPLVKSGRLVALLTLQQNAPRAWTRSELRLIEEVAERTWAALGQARAEAELRASEARLSEAFKIQTVGVMFWGQSFRLADTNDAFLRMTGFTREEALGKTWQELTPPEFHAASRKAVSEITSLGETRPYEKQYFRKDGSRWWGLFAARKVGDEVVEFVLDVTARKEAEARISDSEVRLHAIFEGASVGLSEIDDAGRLVRVNDELGRILGRSRRELLGLSVADVTHPDDLPETLALVEGVMSGRIGGRESGLDKRYLRPDGSIVWAHSSATLLSGNGKGPGSLLVVTVDLTERRAAEAAMRESEERFRQFGDASSDALWIRDAGTLEWEYLSHAFDRIYGIRREDALASRSIGFLMDLVHPDDRDATHAAIRELRDRPRTYEYRIRRPSDGEERWLRTTGFRLYDPDGRVQRLGGITHDATEERQAADRMEVLLAELQHRTRNLVGVVRSMATRTLKRSASLEDFGTRFGDRLAALARVNGLLSRLEEGDRVTFDELIETELRGYGVTDEDGHGSQVEVTGPRGIGLPSASVQTLALALHELLTNAAKYGALSRPEGRLHVAWDVVKGDPACLRFEWRETGIVAADADLAPRKGGYGRELIERALPYQFGAETTYALEPNGLRCVVLLPLPERRRRRDHEQ